MDSNKSNKNSKIDSSNKNKKPRLEETAATLHIEHENISSQAVVNTVANLDDVMTNNIDNNQPGATKNKVPNLGERKTCPQTQWTDCSSEYEYFQLREFVGEDGNHL